MTHAAVYCALNQRAGMDRIVSIVAERITDRVWNDNGGGKVDDRFDAEFANSD
jgi:hypothetical protein